MVLYFEDERLKLLRALLTGDRTAALRSIAAVHGVFLIVAYVILYSNVRLVYIPWKRNILPGILCCYSIYIYLVYSYYSI